jgi:hypothetical protein
VKNNDDRQGEFDFPAALQASAEKPVSDDTASSPSYRIMPGPKTYRGAPLRAVFNDKRYSDWLLRNSSGRGELRRYPGLLEALQEMEAQLALPAEAIELERGGCLLVRLNGATRKSPPPKTRPQNRQPTTAA